jgi:transcriptional regulator with XRE-family HTH domain
MDAETKMKIGQKIRRLRKLRGLTIEELSNHADLTKGFISQLERDKTVPTIVTLKQVLDVLGVEMATFFDEFQEREKNIFSKKDRVSDKTNKNYITEVLIPKLQYLEMEPVLITLLPSITYSKKYEEDEGFGFIVKGRVELTIGKEQKIVQRGDCFYLFFDNKLSMKNLSKKTAEVLVVNY